MILRIIESIRQKPKAVRQHYAFIVAVAFTTVVAGVWSLSLPARFSAVPALEGQTASAPFSGVWGQLKQQMAGLTGKSTTSVSIEDPITDTTAVSATLPITDSLLLESGSTITFGATDSAPSAPAILIGTTSVVAPASPEGE